MTVTGADHLSVLVAQAREDGVELATRLIGDDGRLSRRGDHVARRRDRCAEREASPSVCGTATVAGLVGHDPKQPWPDRCPVAKT
jgi:hypothetical protein